MKSIMMVAAVAVCGLSVLVSGCAKEEAPADKAGKDLSAAVEKAKDAQKDATKAADKAAADAKKEAAKAAEAKPAEAPKAK